MRPRMSKARAKAATRAPEHPRTTAPALLSECGTPLSARARRGHAMITAVNRGLQIGLPFDAPTDLGVAPTTIGLAPTAVGVAPVYFVRHRRARRYLLRVDPDGRLRVTIPRGGSKREAEAFALRNEAWVAGQRARLTTSVSVRDETRLRAQAQNELPIRLRQLAVEHDVAGLDKVSIRNQRTRWGSCGHGGHITLNWRLVLMPPSVRDYVLIHELMHLRRLDHSPAYWRLVAQACPWYTEARAWLRVNGRTLR